MTSGAGRGVVGGDRRVACAREGSRMGWSRWPRASSFAMVASLALAMSATLAPGAGALDPSHVGVDAVARATRGLPTVTVHWNQGRGIISDSLLGVNHRFARAGFGAWDARADRPQPAVVRRLRRAGVSIIRFPGGKIANLFDWKQLDRRPSRLPAERPRHCQRVRPRAARNGLWTGRAHGTRRGGRGQSRDHGAVRDRDAARRRGLGRVHERTQPFAWQPQRRHRLGRPARPQRSSGARTTSHGGRSATSTASSTSATGCRQTIARLSSNTLTAAAAAYRMRRWGRTATIPVEGCRATALRPKTLRSSFRPSLCASVDLTVGGSRWRRVGNLVRGRCRRPRIHRRQSVGNSAVRRRPARCDPTPRRRR